MNFGDALAVSEVEMTDHATEQTSIDPVCGMTVSPATAAGVHEYNGSQYYFCSKSCLQKFAAQPGSYLLGPIAAEEETANYTPLIVIILLISLCAAALAFRDVQQAAFSLEHLLRYFMTGFFLVFAGFKLIAVNGFAEGYSTYDLLAMRWYGYGYVYPFIELAFGLAMLAGHESRGLFVAELIVMTFSGVGVAIKILKGERFQCACLGTFLKVPLTKVTLIEDFGMAALALAMLLLK